MKNLNTAWRKTASTIYKKPTDSKILGSVELDVTVLEEYLMKERQKGLKITFTHFFVLATAKAAASHVPELNTFVKRGKICSHEQVVATVSILQPNGEMSSALVPSADSMNFEKIESFLSHKISETRVGHENATMQAKNKLNHIPWPLSGLLYQIVRLLTVNLGLSFWGINASSFGSFVVSNIGSLGLDVGYPALLPSANVSMVLLIGKPSLKPWVVDGEVKPRKIMTISAAIDHRMMDASHAGKLFNFYRAAIRNPESLNSLT